MTQFEDVMRAVLEVKPDGLITLAYLLGGGEGNPHYNIRLNILGRDRLGPAGVKCRSTRSGASGAGTTRR